ncbi:ribose transport system substrate-binding protein [Pseudoxanthobacter soli DSM 19599]|uniref:Ribose transport system substrate-binding protein n=1 Tax=Pseudoxanthobacter soli DSM 19599 TaxID=1123029 RepID=A0A1M7ZNV4_9HYPH|nr:substrate-binding domain-containing protein [Pseudoxanthobacter soli]SHO66557.1 ribose transport system substrate-binding protein [Pseudoxanthobacter soli DSM 19599]
MKKKYVIKSLLATLAVSLAFAAPAAHAQDKKVLGVALPNLTNPYYVAMKKSFEENGAKQGFDVRVMIADNDDAKQLSQIQTLVQQGVSAVALNCVSSGPCVASVSELNQAKIPVFTINLLPDPEGLKAEGLKVEQAVQTDQKAGGVYIGQQLLKDIGADGKAVIGIVGEPTSVSANARDDGFKEALASNPNVKFVALVNGKVEETTSLKVTTEMLQGNPDITVVYSDTEPAALGAIAAIQQIGRDDVKLYAFVDKLGVKHIEENSILKAGAIQEPAKLAQIQVENIKKFLDGEKLEPVIDSPPLLVNKDNAAEVVDKAY